MVFKMMIKKMLKEVERKTMSHRGERHGQCP